jgi:hypothetical protein
MYVSSVVYIQFAMIGVISSRKHFLVQCLNTKAELALCLTK